MQINAIGNSNSSVGFGSRREDNLKRASAFVNMDDAELREMTYVMTYDKNQRKKDKKASLRAFYAIPVVDVIAKGILENGKLGEKALKSTKVAGGWIGALAVLGLYNTAKKAIMKKSENLNNSSKNNPLTSLVVDLAIFAGALIGGRRVLGKLQGKLYNVNHKPFQAINSGIKSAVTMLNESKFSTKVMPKISERIATFTNNNPRIASFGESALRNAVWITFGLGLLSTSHRSKKQQAKLENNFQELKQAQAQVAKHLSNQLGVERDVLAQDHAELAGDLRFVMNETVSQE